MGWGGVGWKRARVRRRGDTPTANGGNMLMCPSVLLILPYTKTKSSIQLLCLLKHSSGIDRDR